MNYRTPLARSLAAAVCATAALFVTTNAMAAPTKILFVGNSYTFGRLDPVMSYQSAAVHDLTAAFYAVNQTGANPWEPHPWGGVPGIFKQLTVEAGLDYDVSISARNAASLRGHFLNTANSDWDLRGNIASGKWDVVVIQEQSDAALPAGFGKNANLPQFNAYADKIEKFVHVGTAFTYTETQLYGSLAACMATGLSSGSCGTSRPIPANPNANPAAKIYLTDSWARPDMVYPHLITVADTTSPTGSPIPDTSSAGGAATLYYNNLQGMTTDLHNAFLNKLGTNAGFTAVLPVGDAFQTAYNLGLVKTSGFYKADGTFAPNAAGDKMNLWWDDYLHASKYGSYLDALVQFGVITGLNPMMFGPSDKAASDLLIAPADAATLQYVASLQLGFRVPVLAPSRR